MGSGGLIVMDETSCMVDVAKYFMEFCRDESCGKCIPCRAGTVQMWGLLDKITQRRGDARATSSCSSSSADLLKSTSLCGLGQTAPNPVVSTLRYFRDEYLAHIDERRCPAGVCKIAPQASFARRRARRCGRERQDLHPERQAGERGRGPDDPRRLRRAEACPSRASATSRASARSAPAGSAWSRSQGCNKLLPACMTRVEEGMVVTTNSERLQSYRRMIVELLFAERNHVCAICVVNGYCELQKLGYAVGMDHVRFAYQTPALADRRLAPALRPRQQPLRPLPALRARLRRGRGRPHLGRDGPRRSAPGHHRPQRALGPVAELHELRQVRAGLPDRRPLREGRPKAEMVKNRDFLVYLKTAREKKLWIR